MRFQDVAVVCVIVLLLLVGAYFGGYYALMHPNRHHDPNNP